MNKSFLIGILSAFAFSCGPGQSSQQSVKMNQYYVEGERLYQQHCSNCHQKSGKGLGLLYPPLDQSDYMENNLEEVICLMKYGKSGEILVNGKSFNQPMPGIPTLTGLEIAEIATYIFNTWSHERGIIEVNEVTRILESCDQN